MCVGRRAAVVVDDVEERVCGGVQAERVDMYMKERNRVNRRESMYDTSAFTQRTMACMFLGWQYYLVVLRCTIE